MRLKPAGKLAILILLTGLALGGHRLWAERSAGAEPNNTTGTGGTSDSGAFHGVEIPLLTSASKEDWLETEVAAFNRQHADKWHVVISNRESRDAMHAILDGKARPALWSSSSPIWSARLADAWTQQKHQKILDVTDGASFKVFLRSPLVVLTTRQKAAYLGSVFHDAHAWQRVRALSTGKERTPWGAWRFSHADPLTSNSGMLTLGLMLSGYAQAHPSASLATTAGGSSFVQFLKEVERGLVFDTAAEQGSATLARAFVDDPGSRDFITTYESSALILAQTHPDLAVIYPNPTVVAEQSLCLLNADWVSPEQREGGQAFLDFLGNKESLQAGVKAGFRPVQNVGTLSLTAELQRNAPQGFQESFTSVELPPYEALNGAAFQWRQEVAHGSRSVARD